MTSFSLIPGATAADLASPTSAHIRLLALQQKAQPTVSDDARLRTAIVNVANYYLRMAKGKTPAEMETLIWQHDSIDGVDHGASCAAFASLTLELAAQVVGQQSWVTGGTSYPWPLHKWVDARVDTNPASPGITSIVQDAQAHGRWRPLGDGYQPHPGDWVLFAGHVEVVTDYSGGVLHTIGGDSLPNFSVNAHQYPGPLGAQGVTGFVNNGALPAAAGQTVPTLAHAAAGGRAGHEQHSAPGQAAIPGVPGAGPAGSASTRPPRGAAVSAVPVAGDNSAGWAPSAPHQDRHQVRPGTKSGSRSGQARGQSARYVAAAPVVPGAGVSGLVATVQAAKRGAASIPGVLTTAQGAAHGTWVTPGGLYGRHQPPAGTPSIRDSQSQQAFINEVARGAMATQRKYGVPAAVTIAQAIDESGWGRSYLATQDHNLFGIKGNGPAGSDIQPTQEFQNGQAVSQIASFRVYHSIAQSIEDHGRLIATGAPYAQSMGLTHDPNAFANSLTGVYATDPSYGTKLVGIMQRFNLYRYDRVTAPAAPGITAPAGPARTSAPSSAAPTGSAPAAPTPRTTTPRPSASRTKTPGPVPTSPVPSSPVPTSPVPASPIPGSPAPGSPAPGSPAPTSAAPAPTAPTGTPPTGSRTTVSPPRATPPTASAPRTVAPARSARRAAASGGAAGGGTSSTPAIPGVSQPSGLSGTGSGASSASHGAPHGQGRRFGVRRSAANTTPTTNAWSARRLSATSRERERTITAHTTAAIASRYQAQIPPSVKNAFMTTARGPLATAEPLYRDIAGGVGIRWELLAACDWMQCRSQPRFSPVHGEKLGAVNSDGTTYRTKSAALEQCAHDLIELAHAVYRIDLTARGRLSVRELANVFAAFRWGGLLKIHHTSAMEFPYSVAGLSPQHINMRWPKIDQRNTPDKPGGRFRMPFGAVPVVLSLNYPATV